MFGPETAEAITALTLQSRIKNLEQQIEALTETQKNILQHLREVVMVVAEISEESSEE